MGSGAGSWALKGFDYQAAVSVWLALDLMVANKLAAEMILEHVSEEDVEAEVEEFEPGTVADAVPMRGYRLIVQAKRREGNAWTEGQFIKLLEHGEQRTSALKRLTNDENARYLLITSAALNKPVRQLGVRNAGVWPNAADVPANIAAKGKDIAGRLAIIAMQDDERLVIDVKSLLLERFRVPNARWKDCFKVLREDAWNRMRGLEGGRWTREQVEAVIAEHEGYLVGGFEQDKYVQPTNWGDLTQALENRHAVMIIGQSGSGKTRTAEALWHKRRAAIPGLKRVHITHGPEQLRVDKTQPPVFYEIEDPWGRFKFEPDSRPWNDRLASAFESARHDRIFVATSRSDVAAASGAEKAVQRWRMPLDAENYGRTQLRQLYRNLSKELPEDLLAFAHEREATVLNQLGLPLELRKFFDGLPDLDRAEMARYPEAALAEAIRRAHRDSIERTVVDQIGARDAVKPAAVVWALIKPYGRLSVDVLRNLDDRLVDAEPALEGKIGGLANSFVAARNLRQGADGSLAYYHGKVEAGIEAALAEQPQAVRRTLGHLVNALLARDDDQGGSWGLETAAEIMRLSDRIAEATPTLSHASQDRIDRHVEDRLGGDARGMDEAIKLAAAVGSSRSNLAETARWLEYRRSHDFPHMMDWSRPERDAAWLARMRADPAVRTLLEAYVLKVLPTTNTRFPNRFAEFISELAGKMTDVFRTAALGAAGYGYINNDDVLAAGALADLAGFEPVVDAAVAARTPSDEELAQAALNRLIVINDEVSEDYAEHLADNDNGMTAYTYLEAYVRVTRSKNGHAPLAGHRHLQTIRAFWLRALARSDAEISVEERIAAFDATFDQLDEELLWTVLERQWDDRFADGLLDRLVGGHAESMVRLAALGCAAVHITPRLDEVVDRIVDAGDMVRLVELADDLVHKLRDCSEGAAARQAALEAMLATLPDDARAIAEAAQALLNNETPDLAPAALALLAGLVEPPEDLRVLRVRLAQQIDLDAIDDVRWILAESDDRDAALAAIDLAIARAMQPEIDGALDHRFAHVAARAIKAVVDPLPAPLPPALLERANRDSHPVRQALLDQLAAKPHADHLPTLILLTGDEYSRWSRRESDDGHYPIARGAVEAITAMAEVADETLAGFMARYAETEDPYLMRLLLGGIVRHGDQERQAQVVVISRKGPRLAQAQAAAGALLDQHEHLTEDTVGAISLNMMMRLPASIAGDLIITTGLRGSPDQVDAVAQALAQSDDRKVLLALFAFALRERDHERAQAVAALLPEGHPARVWASGEEIAIEKAMLIDLGDAGAIKEAYNWMQPAKPPKDPSDVDLP